MTLNGEKNGNVFVVGLSGKLDMEGAKLLVDKMTQFLAGGERSILLDFTDITYINSAGLRGSFWWRSNWRVPAGCLFWLD